MQVAYEANAHYSQLPVWNFSEEDAGPTLRLNLTEHFRPPVIEVLRGVFVAAMPHRHLLQLLAITLGQKLCRRFADKLYYVTLTSGWC
jgi:hypothetical protein